MSGDPTISVVVLNRDRIAEIGRLLKSLDHQTERRFELVIVSNQIEEITRRYPETARATLVPFQRLNISAARNAGIAASHGDLVAFCDDDAVPEPTWLANLVRPFDDPEVGAVGGLVRGRNGVSLQWGPQETDCFGNDWPLTLCPKGFCGAASRPDRVIKTVGTNCMFRRTALADVSGFDEAYRFYLDETDLNWRLAAAGWKSVITGTAEVHHCYARSPYRTSERVPLSLFEIGASKAVFCNRFGVPSDVRPELEGFRNAQRSRLIRAFNLGRATGAHISNVMQSLDDGYQAAPDRAAHGAEVIQARAGIRPYCTDPAAREVVLLTAGFWNRDSKRHEARDLAGGGALVTLIEYYRTPRMLTVKFNDDGYWLHRGGSLGRSQRDEPIVKLRSRRHRIDMESRRIALPRGLKLP